MTLNDALRDEVQRLKLVTGQAMPNGGQMMNFGSSFGANQYYNNSNKTMHTLLAAHQFQQLQIHPQQQQQQQQQLGSDTKIKGMPPLSNRESDKSTASSIERSSNQVQ
ncbi:hypothetical protein ACLOJK_008951 [Asimina triloba]